MGLNWYYNDKDFTEDLIGDNYGFVYQITNLTNGRKYIGKKFFYSAKTKQVKGKKKKIKVSSDWQTYYGSSAELSKDVLSLGHEKFKREILHLCLSKGDCGYLEAKEQFVNGALESDDYYNTWIMVRVRKSHLKGIRC
jgi:antitoxin component YwqK of YwqJK toxin-antitoxin module